MTSEIRAIIVDDEPPARKLLKSLLAEFPRIKIVGEAGDVASAVTLYEKEIPELIFLDIQLPRSDGFSLLPKLVGNPEIIFITAFDTHAVRAFEVNALDYLLKPINPERLAKTIERVTQKKRSGEMELSETDKVALRGDSKMQIVPVTAITHIEAEDNYSRVHLENDQLEMVRRTLSVWENILPGSLFTRLDRSLIIQINAVQDVFSESRDQTWITLAGASQRISLGRKASVRLRKAMKERLA
ncbi:LytR/AlgR family response regulator transcription factor [Luteolibacter algae]|uniref:LytR/AlgR family response regulator transcription factor n=1 Tax=Luteolibacter algae TaxID=454151 RepID=A0ABW5D603_9BACT